MAPVTLERVAEDAKSLTFDEQRTLRDRLDAWLVERHGEELEARERLFEQHLLTEGIISHVPERDLGYEEYRHPPIVVEGEPVSETIIRERR